MRNRIVSMLSSLFFLFFAATPSYVSSQNIDDIVFITENYPPYNFKMDGKLQGISVELLLLIFQKLNATQSLNDITLKPWARGYNALVKKKNTCLFSAVRTPERENLFKWVGPIAETTISLIARKDQNIIIKSEQDLMHYKIGAVIDDVGEQLLLQAGVKLKNLDRIGGINVIPRSIKKLNKGRFEVWAYVEDVALWGIQKNGFTTSDYEVVYRLGNGALYYAFHESTADTLIKELQGALDELKEEGKLRIIMDKYKNHLELD